MRVRFPCVAPFSSRLISLFSRTCSPQPHDVHFTWAVCSAEFVWSPLVRVFTWLMAGKHAGHRCKAKAKRLHPVTKRSLASHGSASRSWQPPATCTGRCLVCGVSKSRDEPFRPGVDCCLKDWEVYLAFTHLGTFDDFVQIKSNDERIARQIQQARQLLSKKASATWPATEVREEDEVGQ